jgi:anti-anti-sigma factor
MKEISIRIKEHGKKDDKSAEVFIEGEFSIGNAERVKDKLLEVMEQYDKIEVKVQNLENIDLSAIQLLLSFRKSLPMDKFKLSLVLREDLKPIIEHAGFNDILLN